MKKIRSGPDNPVFDFNRFRFAFCSKVPLCPSDRNPFRTVNAMQVPYNGVKLLQGGNAYSSSSRTDRQNNFAAKVLGAEVIKRIFQYTTYGS